MYRNVADLMTTDVKTLGRNDSLSIADEVMRMERIRHLVVLDEYGRLAGIVSQRDLYFNALVRALGFGTVAKDRTLQDLPVKSCMVDDPITVTPETPLSEAAALLVDHKIGALPVVEADRLVGILTETDLLRAWTEAPGSS
ncbi:MAG: CBS domain-containing protein [Thermoanaerobaculia bacterium]|nr:CBS domain-containing protein [Thermoanaerobaculia bacterium]